MNGYNAGQTFIVDRQLYPADVGNHNFVAALPLKPPPDWLPPLSFRDAFVLDELAVWFCDGGLDSVRFQWREYDLLEVVRVLWEKRIPVYAEEVVRVLLAHGLPSSKQNEAEHLIRFGLDVLIAAKSRPPVKNRRLASFDDVHADHHRVSELFIG